MKQLFICKYHTKCYIIATDHLSMKNSVDIIDNKTIWQRYNCNPPCIRLDIASQITISVCQSCLYFLWENEQEGNMSRRISQCNWKISIIFVIKIYFNRKCNHCWSWWKIELLPNRNWYLYNLAKFILSLHSSFEA